MNRYDEIQATARDIASNVHADPAARDAMADGLIRMVGLMVGAVGKAVAIQGEQRINESEGWVFELDTESIDYSDAEVAERKAEFEAERSREAQQGSALYAAGEWLQEAATETVASSVNRLPGARGRGQGVDLERWRRPTPGDPCRCGHVPQVHEDGQPCNGEQFNDEPCKGGPCNGFVRAEPTGGWVHVDRRPQALRPATPVAPLRAVPADDGDLPVGAVVYPLGAGLSLKSRGLVLGPWPGARNDRVAVWWTHKGAATPDTCSYESSGGLHHATNLTDLPFDKIKTLRNTVGDYEGAATLRAAMDAVISATHVAPRPCCSVGGPCATCRNGGPVGRCCFLLRDVCPSHH